MLASENGHTEVVNLLLSGGADQDMQDEKGASALMFASCEGHTEVVEQLLDKGAAMDMQAKEGQSALMYASSAGHTEVVQLLLGKVRCCCKHASRRGRVSIDVWLAGRATLKWCNCCLARVLL